MTRAAGGDRLIGPPVFSILLISAAALAHEVLLMRLFSIIQWHHFAYMIISLALLGYGASGTFVPMARGWLVQRYRAVFLANGMLFGVAMVGCFLAAQRIPFNALEILWDRQQWWYLLLAYLLLLLPFFLAANCIVLTFSRFGDQIPRIYGYDLTGAGVGALGVILALFVLPPEQVLRTLGLLVLGAMLLAAWELGVRGWAGFRAVAVAGMALLALLPDSWLDLKLSPYKPLSQTLQVAGARLKAEYSSPLGQIAVVENSRIPFRLAPGMSLNNRMEPLPQLGLFVDGGGPLPLTRYEGDRQALGYLDFQTSALPYHVKTPTSVLVVGLGGGSGVLQAEHEGVKQIEAVEFNPQLVELFREVEGDFTGWRWLVDHVRLHTAEARGYLLANAKEYDQIQIALSDEAGASAAGLYALSENYLYTREGLSLLYSHLTPGGLLAITRWVKLPPRDGLKMFATAVAALQHRGIGEPGRQLAMIRGWSTSTLLIKRGAFTGEEIRAMKSFCAERSFDLIHYPGISEQEANRFNQLSNPYFFTGAKALLGKQAQRFMRQYKFDIHPATDDRPFFFNFFKWSALPEIVALHQRGGFSLLELGYPVLVLTLIQAVAVSLVLVLLPLKFVGKADGGRAPVYTLGVVGYFLAIGLAYLFVEIAFIQKFILFLSHPLYSVAVVLSGFLIFSGLGSHYARREAKLRGRQPILMAVVVLSLIAVVYLWLLPRLFSGLAGASDLIKVVTSLMLIAPLAFCMGMPFPLGLSGVAEKASGLVPWAWGVNGFASLISAILATLMAIHLGFAVVILAALSLYLAAAWLDRKILRSQQQAA